MFLVLLWNQSQTCWVSVNQHVSLYEWWLCTLSYLSHLFFVADSSEPTSLTSSGVTGDTGHFLQKSLTTSEKNSLKAAFLWLTSMNWALCGSSQLSWSLLAHKVHVILSESSYWKSWVIERVELKLNRNSKGCFYKKTFLLRGLSRRPLQLFVVWFSLVGAWLYFFSFLPLPGPTENDQWTTRWVSDMY